MKLNSLKDRVVVITGASSGIGKLAVERFLQEGAKVVLAARSDEDMEAHLRELGAGEARAIKVKTDVSQYDQIESLAQETLRQFEKIDIWVNNAAVNAYGYIEDQDIEDIRRIIDVDLLGAIYGMKVALAVMLEQGYGNIINIGSIDAVASLPLQAAYDAAKHGLLGFSCALREELMTDRYKDQDIHVVDILPSSMDTPLGQHAKTTTDKLPRPMPPIYNPELTVKAIIKHAKKPKPLVLVGGTGKILAIQARLMPTMVERFLSRVGVQGTLTRQSKSEWEGDNLYETMPGSNAIRGGGTTLPEIPENGLSGYIKRHPVQTAAIGVLPFMLAMGWVWKKYDFSGKYGFHIPRMNHHNGGKSQDWQIPPQAREWLSSVAEMGSRWR